MRRSPARGRHRGTSRNWDGARSGSGTGRCGRSSGCSRRRVPTWRRCTSRSSIRWCRSATWPPPPHPSGSGSRRSATRSRRRCCSPSKPRRWTCCREARLDLGVGSGWLAEEFTGSGAPMAARGARADEYVAALRAIWGGAAGYTGTFFTIPPGRQEPRPVQRPGPPVLIGGMSRRGDGAGRADRRRLGNRVERGPVHDRRVGEGRADRRAGGRDAARRESSAAPWCGPGKPSVSKTTGKRRLLSGSYEQIREDIGWLESCGVSEVFYDLNFDRRDRRPGRRRGQGGAARVGDPRGAGA